MRRCAASWTCRRIRGPFAEQSVGHRMPKTGRHALNLRRRPDVVQSGVCSCPQARLRHRDGLYRVEHAVSSPEPNQRRVFIAVTKKTHQTPQLSYSCHVHCLDFTEVAAFRRALAALEAARRALWGKRGVAQ